MLRAKKERRTGKGVRGKGTAKRVKAEG